MVDDGTLRRVSWRDLFPWLLLLRVFRLSTTASVLLAATVAVWLVPLGWAVSEMLFVSEAALREDVAYRQLVNWQKAMPSSELAADSRVFLVDETARSLMDAPGQTLHVVATSRARQIYQRFVAPFRSLFDRQMTFSKLAYLTFGGLWTLLIWSFVGGTITRVAAVRLGCEQRIGILEAARFAVRRLLAYFAAPLFPLLAVAGVVLVASLLGLLMRSDVGVIVAGAGWGLMLLGGLLMATLLLGLLFGWPLMWPTISSEESGDIFEATQRCYSYTFERPLHYLCYAVLATLLGALGWLLVSLFAEAVIGLSFWGVSWGAGQNRLDEVLGATMKPGTSPLLNTGATLLGGWVHLVRSIAAAYVYSFFWCAATAIYLLLRQDVDQTELDEVFVEEEQDRYGLPPLQLDEAGVPVMAPENPETTGPAAPAADASAVEPTSPNSGDTAGDSDADKQT